MTDQAIEREVQAKGLTDPRVTLADLKAYIASEHYFTAHDGVSDAYELLGLLTVCVLVLRNGLTVTGESACVRPESFDAEISRKLARDNAVQKISGNAKGVSFGLAIQALKDGRRVARAGWNGKGMWLSMAGVTAHWNASIECVKHMPDKRLPDGWQGFSPFIAMYTADGMLVPWLASQTDMLADDWQLLD